MKRILFSALLTAITFALSAQETVGYTTYDLQTNVGSCRRVAMDAAGNIAITYTKSHVANNAGPADRGSGYNYFDGTAWSEGTDFTTAPGTTFTRPDEGRTGWPNVAILRNGNVAIAAHFASSTTTDDGLSFIDKAAASTSWTQTGLHANTDLTWCRMASSGDSIIIISTGFENAVNGFVGGLAMYRSYDAGVTWAGPDSIEHVTDTNFPVRPAAQRSLGADSYAIDANEDGTVAIVLGHYNNFMLKSTDFGENWTITPIVTTTDAMGTANPGYSGAIGETLDTLNGADAAYSVVVEDNGDVHAWWGLSQLIKTDAGSEGTNYFPLVSNLQYWNESMTSPMTIPSTEIRPEQTGECGALFPSGINDGIQNALYGAGYISHSSGGYDENGNLFVTYAGMRAAIVDADGNGTNLNDAGLLYKDVYLLKSEDGGATWIGPMNVSDEPNMACVHPGIPRKIYGSEVPVIWQQDEEPGSFIQSPAGYTVPYTDNYIMYESVVIADIEETYPWLALNGLESVDLLIGSSYTDAGLDLPDDASCWTIDSETDDIDNTTAGTYSYTYTVTNTETGYTFDVVREVNVIAMDVTPPVITIIGNASDTIEACDTWVDPGATAFDNIDFDNVTVTPSGTVDATTPGDYIITYETEDAAQNDTTAIRTVVVVDTEGPTITFAENPVYHYQATAFTAPTPTYDDCTTDPVTITSNDAGTAVDVNTLNNYIVTYNAEDDYGNPSTSTLSVIVGREPLISDFTVTPLSGPILFSTDAAQVQFNPTEWIWDMGDGTITPTSTASNTHTYTADGTYNVCVSVKNVFNDPPFNQNVSQTCKNVLVGVGIRENALDANINIYPNPTNGALKVEITDAEASDLTISITNVVGATIATKDINTNKNSSATFDLSSNAAGIYFVKISSEDASTTQRVVVR